MTVEECYEKIGGSYKEVISRMRTDERVKKFMAMFLKDGSYSLLIEKMETGEYSEAFRAAHTLKGVCQNMAFTTLYHSSNAITEVLRGGDGEAAKPLLGKVIQDYEDTIKSINELLT